MRAAPIQEPAAIRCGDAPPPLTAARSQQPGVNQARAPRARRDDRAASSARGVAQSAGAARFAPD
jgi:hypothetical protein